MATDTETRAPEKAADDPSAEAVLLAEIKAKQAEVDVVKRELDYRKEEVKELKADWEMKVAELASIIKEEPEHLPLFDGQKKQAEPVVNDAWRSASINELALGVAITNALLESDITTIGRLEEVRAEGDIAGMGLRSIKGIGEAKAQKIEEAVLDWLTRNRDSEVLGGEQAATEETTWRSRPIAVLPGLPHPIQQALQNVGLGTLGAIAEFEEAKGAHGLDTLKDMGGERGEMLSDLIAKYRAEHATDFAEEAAAS